MSTAWAFTLAYNEAKLIGYWVRNHLTFCEKVIVFVDTDSDDGTFEIAQNAGADVRPWTGSGLDDVQFVDFASSAYREAQSDWVIWLDADEFLYHPYAAQYLDQLQDQGVTYPNTEEYTMVSSGPPVHSGQIYDLPEFRKGTYVQANSKVAIFNPKLLTVQWQAGKHTAIINGPVVRDDGEHPFKILHYRLLGEDYFRARNARNFARLSARNIAGMMGYQVHPTFVGPYDPGWTGPNPADAFDVFV